jgi:hypothetical protein
MEAAASTAPPAAASQIFRAHRHYVAMGLVGAVLYAVATVAVLSWPVTDAGGPESKPQDNMQAYIAGGMFAAFALMNAYTALLGSRYRLILSPDAIRVVGIFTDRSVRLADVTRASWQCIPSTGALVLYTGKKKSLVVERGNFEQWHDLCPLLRERLAPSVQEGFDEFEKRFSRQLRPPVVVKDRTLLSVSLAGLALVAATWGVVTLRWSWAAPFIGVGVITSATVTLLAAWDTFDAIHFRRPVGRCALALAISLATTAWMFLLLRPLLPPLSLKDFLPPARHATR